MSRSIETSDEIAGEAVAAMWVDRIGEQRARMIRATSPIEELYALLQETYDTPAPVLHVDEARRRGIIGYAGELRGVR